jgi:hypothetical protein
MMQRTKVSSNVLPWPRATAGDEPLPLPLLLLLLPQDPAGSAGSRTEPYLAAHGKLQRHFIDRQMPGLQLRMSAKALDAKLPHGANCTNWLAVACLLEQFVQVFGGLESLLDEHGLRCLREGRWLPRPSVWKMLNLLRNCLHHRQGLGGLDAPALLTFSPRADVNGTSDDMFCRWVSD